MAGLEQIEALLRGHEGGTAGAAYGQVMAVLGALPVGICSNVQGRGHRFNPRCLNGAEKTTLSRRYPRAWPRE